MAYRTTGKVSAGCAASIGAALFSAVAMAQSLPDLHGKSLAYAGWGGDTQKYQDEAWLKPFAKATGVKIDQTDTPTVAALKTQQEANNVGIDVMQIDSSIVDGGCGTVFQEAKIDRSQLDPALDRNKCGVPVVKFSYVLAYNSAKFKIAPTKVADFFDVEKFPGMRAARGGISNVGLIEGALMADGVEPARMYPIDLERAMKKLGSVKDSIEVKDSFAVLQDGLANGEFDMALLPNGRAFNATKVNPDIRVVFNGAVTIYDNLVIPTGAKNVEAATAFLQYAALNSTQVALTEKFPYGMGTIGDAPRLDDQARAFFPDTYAKELLIQDNGWWSKNDQAVNDRLTALFAQ